MVTLFSGPLSISGSTQLTVKVVRVLVTRILSSPNPSGASGAVLTEKFTENVPLNMKLYIVYGSSPVIFSLTSPSS